MKLNNIRDDSTFLLYRKNLTTYNILIYSKNANFVFLNFNIFIDIFAYEWIQYWYKIWIDIFIISLKSLANMRNKQQNVTIVNII